MTDDRPWDPRTLRALRVAGIGALVVGGGLAAVIAAGGGGGRAGAAGFLVGSAFASGLASLYAMVTAVADLFRERPVGRSRIVAGVGLFVVAGLLTGMVAGLGG